MSSISSITTEGIPCEHRNGGFVLWLNKVSLMKSKKGTPTWAKQTHKLTSTLTTLTPLFWSRTNQPFPSKHTSRLFSTVWMEKYTNALRCPPMTRDHSQSMSLRLKNTCFNVWTINTRNKKRRVANPRKTFCVLCTVKVTAMRWRQKTSESGCHRQIRNWIQTSWTSWWSMWS